MKTVMDSNAFIKCKKALMILLIFVFSAGQDCVGQNFPAKTQKNAGQATLPEVNTKLDNIEQSIRSFREDIEIIKNALPDTLAIRNLVSQSSKSIEELKASVEQLKTSLSSKDGENTKGTQTQLKTNSPDQSISFADQPIIMGLPLWLTVTFIGAILIVIVLLLIWLICFKENPCSAKLIKEIAAVKDLIERQKNSLIQDISRSIEHYTKTSGKTIIDSILSDSGELLKSIKNTALVLDAVKSELNDEKLRLLEQFESLNNNLDYSIKKSIESYYAPGEVDAIYKHLACHGLTAIKSGNIEFAEDSLVSDVSTEQPSNAVLIPNLVPFSLHLVNYLIQMNNKLEGFTKLETELETKNLEYKEKYQTVTSAIANLDERFSQLSNLNKELPALIESKVEDIVRLTAEKAEIESDKLLLGNELAQANAQLNFVDELKEKLESEISATKDLTSQKTDMAKKIEGLEKDLKVTAEENARLNELKVIMPDYEEGLAFFGKLFEDDWKRDILLSFLLLQSEAKNKSDSIRATFSRLDDAIYDTYSDNPSRLKAVRHVMQKKLNEEILDGKYQIQWPQSGDELNERIHSAETFSGNRIKIAKTAIVKDANGTLITKSKVITEV